MDGVGGFEWQTPAWFTGEFIVGPPNNLVGLDANALTISVSGWRMMEGNPSSPYTASTQIIYIG
jgi:hypothetical protein